MRLCLLLLGILCLTRMASADLLPYRTLAALPAQPLTPQAMQATQTQRGGGGVVYTLCPDGCAVSATWNTGSTSGVGTVVK